MSCMISLDRRNRTDVDRTDHDPGELLERVLPGLVHGPHHDLAASGARALGLEALAITVGDRTVVLDPAEDLRLRDGEAPTAVRVSPYALSRVVTDQTSATVLQLEGEVDVERGPIDVWIRWEPVLRTLLSGWEVYAAGAVDLVDRSGGTIDVEQVFTPDDDPLDAGQFLQQCGFLHVRGVFSPGDLSDLAAMVDEGFRTARPGDDDTNTNRTINGDEVVIALLDVGDRWPHVREMLARPGFVALGQLVPETTFVPPTTGIVQHKRADIATGFANTPWHRDCGPGGHSYSCCVLRAGIAMTQDRAGTGMFGAVAGSHRANICSNPLMLPPELPKVMVECRPGDLHLHLSCTFHCGTPPTAGHRRVLYSDFLLPGSRPGGPAAYRDGVIDTAVGGRGRGGGAALGLNVATVGPGLTGPRRGPRPARARRAPRSPG